MFNTGRINTLFFGIYHNFPNFMSYILENTEKKQIIQRMLFFDMQYVAHKGMGRNMCYQNLNSRDS